LEYYTAISLEIQKYEVLLFSSKPQEAGVVSSKRPGLRFPTG